MIVYFLDMYAVVGGRCRVVQPLLCSGGEGCSSNWLIFCVDLVLGFSVLFRFCVFL